MRHSLIIVGLLILLTACTNNDAIYNLSDFGVIPNSEENTTPLLTAALEKIKAEAKNKKTVLKLEKGKYHFHPDSSNIHEYYISNHDQDNPKKVGFALENMKDITFDGQGSEFIFHGRMLPISLISSENSTLKNFSIDFENPHISQVKILENNIDEDFIIYEIAPWVDYKVEEGKLYSMGEGWAHQASWGIAFEADTKRLVYNTSDVSVGTNNVEEISKRVIKANGWKNDKLIPGTVVVFRSYKRPTPGIFVSNCVNTELLNIKVHYAEGMGLLAQMSENITLDSFSVCLRGDNDPRYFTTQADATHFSGCKGKITSTNGLYEGMMDDAINIHGTYLKLIKRVDDKTVIGKYMHGQAWGFEWGREGDEVQFVKSKTMELFDGTNVVASIKAIDKPTEFGAKEFEITFRNPLDTAINEGHAIGMENLEWTPEVLFANNLIRNNRARGTLFSTPKKTIVENNVFDHTSGTAILLCGDCNGWYETGACKDVIIRGNTFINSLTNMFQFTNAVISIYPEIPDLANQKKYFHSGIVIENNTFEMFDTPILYAKSVNGIIFRNNNVKMNEDYPAFHWNKSPILLERVINFKIENNTGTHFSVITKY